MSIRVTDRRHKQYVWVRCRLQDRNHLRSHLFVDLLNCLQNVFTEGSTFKISALVARICVWVQLIKSIKHAELLENIFDIRALEFGTKCSLLENQEGNKLDVIFRNFHDIEGIDRVDKILPGSFGALHFLQNWGQLNSNIHFQSLFNLKEVHEIFSWLSFTFGCLQFFKFKNILENLINFFGVLFL